MTTSHLDDRSRFSPFTYSIGFETTFAEAETALQEYPLPKPIDDETFRKFMQSLTLVHEATHVVQFVSTAYGLRTLRYTLILLNALAKKPGWHLPVLENVLEHAGAFTPDELRVVDAGLLFLDGVDQLRLHYTTAERDEGEKQSVSVWTEPWSPHFFMGGGGNDAAARAERAASVAETGAHVRSLPHVTIDMNPIRQDLVVNAAALMETYALLGEWNHIFSALTTDAERAQQALPPRPEYHLLLNYALVHGICKPEVLLPTMAAIIDASLMFDPFVLFNVPWDVADEEGRVDCYPGETFISLCRAAREVAPIEAGDRADGIRFYHAICERAGLPEPQWMAEKALEVVQRLIDRTPPGALLARAVTAHRDALKLRCERGAENFGFDLVATETMYQVLGAALPAVSFYNVHTLEPEGFDPQKIDCASIHSILFQAVAHPTIECPLKLGNPFRCRNAGTDRNTLCVWQLPDGTRAECCVDLLEKQCELIPGED